MKEEREKKKKERQQRCKRAKNTSASQTAMNDEGGHATGPGLLCSLYIYTAPDNITMSWQASPAYVNIS